MQLIKNVHARIGNLELELGIQTEEFQTDLNFGLVHVVYRWANSEVGSTLIYRLYKNILYVPYFSHLLK